MFEWPLRVNVKLEGEDEEDLFITRKEGRIKDPEQNIKTIL